MEGDNWAFILGKKEVGASEIFSIGFLVDIKLF